MDYKKLHKDTIAKLQKMVNSGKITVEIARGICADFVPESEDERTRTKLLNLLKELLELGGVAQDTWSMNDCKQFIAWLDKQGELKLLNNEEYQTVPVETLDRLYAAKKELEKLKQYEQKPAEWSEEDEKTMNTTLCIISDFRNVYKDSKEAQKDADKIEDWLKSLRPQSHWKPSKEQLAALLTAIGDEKKTGSDVAKVLRELYYELKKLREE